MCAFCPDPPVYRVTVQATVEANNAEDAQRITGLLLAGLDAYNGAVSGGEDFPLTGPGSWAPDLKVVEHLPPKEDS